MVAFTDIQCCTTWIYSNVADINIWIAKYMENQYELTCIYSSTGTIYICKYMYVWQVEKVMLLQFGKVKARKPGLEPGTVFLSKETRKFCDWLFL